MFARGALAAIDHNSNIDREQVCYKKNRANYQLSPIPTSQRQTAAGVPKFDLVKQRHGKKYFIKVVKEKKDYSFRTIMASLTIQVDLERGFHTNSMKQV